MIGERIAIPGTQRKTWPGTTAAGPLESDRNIQLTAWLRPKKDGVLDAQAAQALGATPPAQRAYLERRVLEEKTNADPADVELLARYCKEFGITVHSVHWRSVVLDGPMQQMINAFGADVAAFVDPNGMQFRHRSGSLHAPREIAAIVRGVFGFEQWPRSQRLGALSAHKTVLSAKDVAERYRFPEADGSGVTIGIVQFRGEFREADFSKCMRLQHVTPTLPVVKRVDNAAVEHEHLTTKDLEAALDAQIAATFAPGARIVIYEAPDDERGFLDAIRTAILDDERCSVLSISYGWPEHLWTPVALTLLDELFTLAALAGVTVLCSSGDHGEELDYDGTPHVLAPASSPFAIACGATNIDVQSGSGAERPWKQSGGGFSRTFASAPWQNVKDAPGRAVPDVAAQQDPGYVVVLDGVELSIGGTSAVAPLWAALAARLIQRLGAPIGFFSPLLYRNAETLFKAHLHWNPRTGLGVPDAAAIEKALRPAP